MEINQAGLDLIKSFEGCKLTAYQDQRGVWTIGYGHTGSDVCAGLTIDEETAEQLLKEDLHSAESTVSWLVKVPLNPNQFSALVSLCYNIGSGNFRTSTLLQCVNESKDPTQEFLKWN